MIVLVLIELEKEYQQRLEAIAREAVFIYDNAKTVKLDVIQSATVILGNPLPDMLAQASHLKWIQTESAGVDKYVLEDVLPEGVILTNATGAYGTIVAEHMLALLLTLCKKIHLSRDLQKQGIWKKCGEMRYVSNSTILVVGLGDIGGAFAKMVKSLGAYVIGIRRSNLDKPDYIDELYLMDALEKQLSRADVVAISLPATNETIGLFDCKLLSKMKRGSILLNVGRGSIVKTADLYELLCEHYLFGAGLDVVDPEPLPMTHPLWQLENVIITPHSAGGYELAEVKRRIIEIWARNLRHFIHNEPLENVIDFKIGYKK